MKSMNIGKKKSHIKIEISPSTIFGHAMYKDHITHQVELMEP